MSYVKLTCSWCGLQFKRTRGDLHEDQDNYYCSQDCLADKRYWERTNHPKSIIQPTNALELTVDGLMKVCAQKTGTMVDRYGNLRPGFTAEEWEEWSNIHDELCDVARIITGKESDRGRY
jgi:hypothetical protein